MNQLLRVLLLQTRSIWFRSNFVVQLVNLSTTIVIIKPNYGFKVAHSVRQSSHHYTIMDHFNRTSKKLFDSTSSELEIR